MRLFLLIMVIILSFLSCEEDDICLDEKTPRVFMKLKATPAIDSIKFDSVLIYRREKNNEFSLVKRYKKPDSIGVSLRIDDVNSTEFILARRRYEVNSYDTIKIEYEKKLDFASKACGYRWNYFDLKIQNSKHLIDSITVLNPNITDEKNSHLLIHY